MQLSTATMPAVFQKGVYPQEQYKLKSHCLGHGIIPHCLFMAVTLTKNVGNSKLKKGEYMLCRILYYIAHVHCPTILIQQFPIGLAGIKEDIITFTVQPGEAGYLEFKLRQKFCSCKSGFFLSPFHS